MHHDLYKAIVAGAAGLALGYVAVANYGHVPLLITGLAGGCAVVCAVWARRLVRVWRYRNQPDVAVLIDRDWKR